MLRLLIVDDEVIVRKWLTLVFQPFDMLPYIVLQDQSKYTIGVNMYAANQLMQYKADWVTLCAGVVLAMIPPVAVYIIFQKHVIAGATVGGLKG